MWFKFKNMKTYNFDTIVDRTNTNCIKYDARTTFFGKADLLPLWVADMDFRTPDFIVDAITKRAEHEIFGYTFRSGIVYTIHRKLVKTSSQLGN